MKNKFFKQRSFYAVFLSVVLSVVLVAGAAGAATTISSNINTGGTLTVSSNSFLNGNINLGDASTGDNDLVYLYGTTTVVGAQAFIFGSSTAATIAGQAAGSVYYDSTNRVLRLYDGANWFPVASSTDAAGGLIVAALGSNENVTPLIRFNDISSALMALGTTSPVFDSGVIVHSALLTLQATSTTNVPLRIINASSTFSEANLFEVLGGDASELFVIDSLGHASSTSGLTLVGGSGSFIASASSTFVSTLGVTGLSIFDVGLITSASSTIGGALYTQGTLYASSTVFIEGQTSIAGTLTVGSDSGGTEIDRIFAGTCSTEVLAGQYAFSATTTGFIHCQNATGVTVGDRVLVMASTSLPEPLIVQGASSTGADAISIIVYSTGYGSSTVLDSVFTQSKPGGADNQQATTSVVLYNAAAPESNVVTFDFWAFR